MGKKLFWILFLVIFFVIAYQIVPIYYKAMSLEGICQKNADIYHRYTKNYTKQMLKEDLDRLGIPQNQRETAVNATKDSVIVEIYYEDTANFFNYYKKDFVFVRECEGVLSSIVSQ